jgi:histone deacetylase 11
VDSPAPRIIYTPRYTIHALGLDRLHPFDVRKHSRAFRLLREQIGAAELSKRWSRPARPAMRDDLLAVHTPGYLDTLRHASTIAGIVEVPQAAYLPAAILDRCLLRPMRWATAGTLLACREALAHGCAINLSGGYHHASADRGEGFCFYDDTAIAIRALRASGELPTPARIIYIDLDAHQGNGVARDLMDDRSAFILDMYNADIYPNDHEARRRIDCNLPLRMGTKGTKYLATLEHELPRFLDAVHDPAIPTLAIYNAGTDPYEHDALGGLRLSYEDILARDRLVLTELTRRTIPWATLPSGGYSPDSYRMIAATAAWAIRELPAAT